MSPISDFTFRSQPADLPELMDAPCSPETLRACLQNLALVNRLTLSYRPTLAFLARVTQALGRRHPPLHILDVGSGYGDTLRVIHGWARRRRIPVTLTGIDLNPNATRAAREATAATRIPAGAITWLAGDALTTALPHPPDLIISSLLTHHLTDGELVDFLRWMDGTAQLGWFINDLERQPVPALLFGLLARTLRWHPFVQHDGPVSFRRAFRTSDWQRLLIAAGISPADIRIRPTFPARLCVERLRGT